MDNVINFNKRENSVRMMRANEVCSLFGIARSTVDSWVRQGILTKKKIGKLVFFNRLEVEALLEVGI